jgi:hypothetical protein
MHIAWLRQWMSKWMSKIKIGALAYHIGLNGEAAARLEHLYIP